MRGEGDPMFCERCGRELEDGARFCAACGAPAASGAGDPEPMTPEATTAAQDAPEPAESAAPVDETQAMPRPACAPEPGPNDDGANAGPAEAAPAAGDAPESAKRAPKPAVITGVAIAAAALIGSGIFAATQLAPKPEAASVEQKKDDKKDDEKADREADAKDAAEGEDEDPAAAEPATQENPLVTEARAAGLAVYTGTIRIFETDAELAGYQGRTDLLPDLGADCGPYAILLLDDALETTITSGDGRDTFTATIHLIGLAQGDEGVAAWRPFAGERISVTCDRIYGQSDVSLPWDEPRTHDARALDERWSGETGQSGSQGGSSTSSSADGSYILPESATRVYSIGELSSLSDWDLMLARNEIYARHGRGFNDADVRSYFQSQSWYTQRYTAEEFDAIANSMLSSTEQANIANIIEIENSR